MSASDFAITYPTTSKVNVNVGDATVTLEPVKTNTNFVGETKEVGFKILPRALTNTYLMVHSTHLMKTVIKIELYQNKLCIWI